jgi:hypothetical protein
MMPGVLGEQKIFILGGYYGDLLCLILKKIFS